MGLGSLRKRALVLGWVMAAAGATTSPAATPAAKAAASASTASTAAAPDITTATARALPPLPDSPALTRQTATSGPPASPPPDLPDSAPPGMRRCVRADGSAVFTDRRCDLMEAAPDGLPAGEPPAPRAEPPPTAQVVRVRSCARTQGDLLEGVRLALEARDANRFAEFYHWTEMGNAEGYQLMERLARFADRTLVDVQLASSQDRAGLESPPGPPAAAPPRRSPDLLRVDQLRGDDGFDTQVTWFHLRSNAGCWWLQF